MEKKITVIPANPTNKNVEGIVKKKQRVAAYCRVSTDHEEQLGSFANQVEYYTNLINKNPDYEMAGIFADEGISGTGTKKRTGFMSMIQACEEGKVDLVITKSISRFARNTQDCLHYSRHLKNLGIPISFEKENINTMDASGELLFTILSSLAQEESRNISENTAWGIRSKFRKGIPQINADNFMGYDKDDGGHLIINLDQAEVVARIYREFLEGWTPSEIARRLNEDGIPGVTGEPRWVPITILRMLQNEKYKGDLLMQKTYTSDFLNKVQEGNEGQLEQYLVVDDHEAIVSREDWEAAQLEIERQQLFKRKHGIKDMSSCIYNPFYAKVFCGTCGGKYIRKNWKGNREAFWKCTHAEKANGKTCSSENIGEETLKQTVLLAWNDVVAHRADYLPKWEEQVRNGDALECLRAKQMIEMTEDGPLDYDVPEITRMILNEIVVMDATNFKVTLMDGTEKTICL